MANSNAIKAGQAFVELTTKNAGFEKGLQAAQARLNAFAQGAGAVGARLAAVGTVATAGLGAALKVFADDGDALTKMSQRTGISVEALSLLNYAMEQSGTSAEAFEKAIRKQQQTIDDASRGNATATDTLGRLGLKLADVAALAPDEQFKAIADRLAGIADPAKRAALTLDVFGKSGAELLPLMMDGAAGIEALTNQARAFGRTVSTETAQQATALGDAVGDAVGQLRRFVFGIGGALAPAVKSAAEAIRGTVQTVTEWTERNRDLIVTAAKVTVGITVAGAAIIAIAGAAKAAALGIGLITGALAIVKGAFALAGAALAAILSPVGLLIAGASALVIAFTDVGEVVGQVVQWIAARFKELSDRVAVVVDGIRAALANGDVALAAKVLWLALRAEWLRGANALNVVWQQTAGFFTATWAEAVGIVAKVFSGAQAGIKSTWIQTISFIAKAWENGTTAVGGFIDDWRTGIAQGAIELERAAGWITDAEANQALLSLQGENKASQRQREEETAARLKDIEDRRLSDLADIESRVGEQTKLIDQETKKKIAEQEKAAEASLNDSANALKAAHDELRAAVNAAARQREDAGAGILPTTPSRLRDQIREGAEAANGSTVNGTFNARAVGGLELSPLLKIATQQLAETKETNKQLSAIADSDGLTFA